MKLVFFLIAFSINLFSQDINPAVQDSSLADTTGADTTGFISPNIEKADSLIPLNQEPFFNGSYFVSNRTITHNDFRYTGDILNNFSLSFIKDQGFIGQPNKFILYGAFYNSSGNFQDGILYNNRNTNILDLNQIQLDYLDSVEIIPLPRAFLYGTYNNHSSVNFIMKDFMTSEPYSRIKYMQGVNGEALVDGIFNALIAKKINFSFDITNKKFDSSFTNSEFNIWQAKVRLKYFASNNFNIIGTYDYMHLKRGLNGGIDIDSISRADSDFNTLFYDENFAPVVFPNQKEEVNQHNFTAKILAVPIKNAKTNLSFYFRFNQDKISGKDFYEPEMKFKNKVFGASLNQKYSVDLVNLNLLINYENSDLRYSENYRNDYYKSPGHIYNNFSFSPIVSLNLFDSTFIPSVYFKYNNEAFRERKKAFVGFGADLLYYFENLKFYIGYSKYNIRNASLINSENFETNLSYTNSYFSARIIYFLHDDFPFIDRIIFPGPEDINNVPYFPKIELQKIHGFGADVNINFFKILLDGSGSYITNADDNLILIPKYKFKAGIYYKDILFHASLNLKTGFILNCIGKQNFQSKYFDQIDPAFTVDFTLIGEIKKVAIIYFTWENLFDKQYFITPYYPMRSSNIRFGLAWELFN